MGDRHIEKICITDNKVFLTAAESNVWSSHFEMTWEQEEYTQLLKEHGKKALYSAIGEALWSEELSITPGNQLCKLFLKARAVFPADMNYRTFDPHVAGSLLGKMVEALEHDPMTDLSRYVQQAVALKDDRDYLLDAATRSGMNYLDFAAEALQADRAFALEILEAGAHAAWFSYPAFYAGDKAFALEALHLNGCFYRELGEELKADREVIMAAFCEGSRIGPHEFLPNLIPANALYKPDTECSKPTLDQDFVFELLETCPSIHLYRAPQLLNNREIAMKWIQVGTYFPHSMMELPKKYLHDPEFQAALVRRFQHTDKYPYLLQYFSLWGITPGKKAVEDKIHTAVSRASNSQTTNERKPKAVEPALQER